MTDIMRRDYRVAFSRSAAAAGSDLDYFKYAVAFVFKRKGVLDKGNLRLLDATGAVFGGIDYKSRRGQKRKGKNREE
jgi:hypothetical protein